MKRISIDRLAALGAIAVAGFCLAFGAPPLKAQEQYPRWPNEAMYDEVKAAPDFYKVRFEDNHIRLVEVTIPPGAKTPMHGDPYPTVIAADGALPKITETPMDPKSDLNGQGHQQAPPPNGHMYPVGMTYAPVAPRTITNNDTFPLHYYKIEFKRIDGDDFKTKWKEWYSWITEPIKPLANVDPRDSKLGPPVSKEYPFAAKTESYIAAPNNHYVRYQDDHVVLLEVTFRKGERENLHGHESSSVFARDIGVSPAVSGPTPAPNPKPPQPATNIPGIGNAGAGGNWVLEPNGVNGQGGGNCAAPTGMKWPSCSTMGVEYPHAASNLNDWPAHFYRIQFKRMDGNDIKTKWKQWYPAAVKK